MVDMRLVLALALVLLVLPVAAAESHETPEPTEAVPDVVETVDGLLDGTTSAATSTISATAAGASTAADGGASLLAKLADAGRAALAAAARAGALVASLAVAAGSALAAASRAAGGALRVVAVALLDAAILLSTALASLAGRGAGYVAAHPKESLYVAGAGGGALAGTALALWLKRLGAFAPLGALYTRIAKGEMLENGVRNSVFEFVRSNPGAHPSAIKERLDLGWGTVVYHLGRLEESGLVTSRKGSGQKCYFVNGGAIPPAAQQAAAALKHPSAREIADFVRANPATTQKALGESLGMSSALVSWHVKRLVAAGILEQERTSLGARLKLTPGTEIALAA